MFSNTRKKGSSSSSSRFWSSDGGEGGTGESRYWMLMNWSMRLQLTYSAALAVMALLELCLTKVTDVQSWLIMTAAWAGWSVFVICFAILGHMDSKTDATETMCNSIQSRFNESLVFFVTICVPLAVLGNFFNMYQKASLDLFNHNRYDDVLPSGFDVRMLLVWNFVMISIVFVFLLNISMSCAMKKFSDVMLTYIKASVTALKK